MTESGNLGRASGGFAWAAVITILFNTVLAWVKDAYQPLSRFMGAMAGHNWTAQGLADVVIFFGLGIVFVKTGWGERVAAGRLTVLLAGAVVVAGVGLVAWYAVF